MNRMDDEKWMRKALEIAATGVAAGQSPFGACIVRDDKPLAAMHNHVWLNHDATAHAEVMAIRTACAAAEDVHLEGATIYSTTEPCPMCFTAIHWARIHRIVFGASVDDAAIFGFNELPIHNDTLASLGGSTIEIIGGVLRDEAITLFEQWRDHAGRAY